MTTTTESVLPAHIWEAAFAALASLVRDEYPESYSLTEIAEQWGSGLMSGPITPEQIEALRMVEGLVVVPPV